jgi:hypothetical protein
MKVPLFDTLRFRMHSDSTMDNATADSRAVGVIVILTPILPL